MADKKEALKLIEQAVKDRRTELDLRDMQLTSVPREIAKLTSLVSLNLSNNHLRDVSPELANLTNLITLDLSNNVLTSLPPEITKLTNLTSFGVSNNFLESFPLEITNLTKLTTLYIGSRKLPLANKDTWVVRGNGLKILPPEIGRLSNLVDLDLSHNQLTSLPQDLNKLTNLTSLNLQSNQLTKLPPISTLTHLNTLILSNNNLVRIYLTHPALFDRVRLWKKHSITPRRCNKPLLTFPTSITAFSS